ncbi:MAG: Serine hydroxymethyltransferase [Candidatus Fermentimicrarchaeum limneticum]|uniref:Serine hydroxymethyltransferase n=1 Tax=Fermentimicrarchaeum limneticum TaxID=2795018 RepID=A0A7D6BMF7_FERL1|nr:MAG: Serine hydroxymethyltransferase [Candidatus Fermentimicrarchaeum limneticum]
MSSLRETDPEVYEAIRNELGRQRYGLELIPSENFASPAVLEAQGSVLTNKYSEGYPHKRYYGGNQFIDVTETLAIERAKKLFGAEHANVQPHAGSQANMAAYFAFMEIGDKMMGLSLTHGGHLSQGSPVNFSGKWYKVIPYYLDKETQMLDYDAIKKIAMQEKPKLVQCGYTAYPRIIDFKAFREIADACGAYFMVDMAHIAGLIAGGAHPSPVPYADVVTSTTHKTLRGPRGAIVLCKEKYALNIDKAVFPGLQGGPLDHVIAAKAVCFKEAMQPSFKEYAKQIVKNAKALAEELMARGFKLVSGGTDNHLLLVDLTTKGMTGKEAQELLDSVGITVNKNTIPYDTQKPFVTSGIRLGTPPLTTRGMKESEMKEVGGMIAKVFDSKGDAAVLAKVKTQVKELCDRFPLYKSLGA